MAKKKKRLTHNYIDDEKFYEEMKKYISECRKIDEKNESLSEEKVLDYPIIPDYIGECIFNIAENLAKKGNFSGYTFRDDMIGDGIENCVKYIRNFNPDKYDKPFAYFTQICFYAFIRRIETEKKQKILVYKLIQNADSKNEFGAWAKSQGIEVDGNDALASYLKINPDDISTYDSKTKKKKKAKRNKNSLEDLEEGNE